LQRQSNLTQVRAARGAASTFAGLSKSGKQHRRKDSYDGDNDKKFDQGETCFAAHVFLRQGCLPG
jgi:hypothetical protein